MPQKSFERWCHWQEENQVMNGKELGNIGSDWSWTSINIIHREYQEFPIADNPCQCSLAFLRLIKYLRLPENGYQRPPRKGIKWQMNRENISP